MNEEDTFNRLRRIPFQEMLNIYLMDITLTSGMDNQFKEYGWTFSEFLTELTEYLKKGRVS